MLDASRQTLIVALGGGSDAQRAQVRETLARIVDPRLELLDPLRAAIRLNAPETRADVRLFVLGADPARWSAQMGAESGPHPAAKAADSTTIALIAETGVEGVRMALRAGADEVLAMPVHQPELERLLVKLCEKRRTASAPRASVCSLASVSGGTGVSYLTVSLGRALGRLTGKRVALLDLDLQSNALATILDLEPARTIGDLADPTSALDSIRLESALCKHESGLCLLAAPARIEEAEMVTASTVGAVLDTMRQLFDFVLVDCGHHASENSVTAWEQSRRVLYVLEQTVTSVRAARRFFALFDRLRLNEVEVGLVLNRFVAGAAIAPREIETALGCRLAASVPRDDRAFGQAQVTGRDLWQAGARQKTRAAIESLARQIAGLPVPEGFGRRVTGLLGAVVLNRISRNGAARPSTGSAL